MTTRNTAENPSPSMALLRNKIRAAVGINEQQGVIGDGNGAVRIDAEPGHVWVRVQQGNGLSQPIKALANAVMAYYEGADCYVANIGANLAVVRARLTNEQTPVVWSYIDSDLNIASAASSFDIQSITQNYDVWRMTMFLRGTTAAVSVAARIRLNGNATAANYVSQMIWGNGATPTSNRDTTNATIAQVAPFASTALTSAFSEITIHFYNVIDTGKLTMAQFDYVSTNGTTMADTLALYGHGIFNSTSAINRIQIIPAAGNWAAGSGWLLEGRTL